jgi:hypothetical protein
MVGLPRFFTANRGKATIYTVKPVLKGTSIQQIVVNVGLTVYMVGLPRIAV